MNARYVAESAVIDHLVHHIRHGHPGVEVDQDQGAAPASPAQVRVLGSWPPFGPYPMP
ncbi:hypothetical protein [Streptomyces sp. NPDC012510]|uniref:hypothetical protein n=1 Tax=Streptomyces sp. NPDC012510 TaxID=3364838 RepID=UPI0036EC3DB5